MSDEFDPHEAPTKIERPVASRPRWPVIGGAALALLLGTFLAGRRSSPAKVVTRDVVKVQTVEVEKIRTVTVHDQVQVHDQVDKVRTVVVTRTRWLPGGTVEATTTTRAATDTQAHEATQEHATATQEAAREAVTHVEQSHTETPVRPKWSLSLQPGFALGAPSVPLPVSHLVVGAALEHRIAGPVLAGVWVSTSGAAGISVRLEM